MEKSQSIRQFDLYINSYMIQSLYTNPPKETANFDKMLLSRVNTNQTAADT